MSTFSGNFQTVYSDNFLAPFKIGEEFLFPIYYDASDPELSGLTLNIHYNSSVINLLEFKSEINPAISSVNILNDTQNLDNDTSTDKVLQFIWATFNNTFPGVSLGSAIANLKFSVLDGAEGQVTPPSSTIRFSAPETASGFNFYSSAISIQINDQPTSLDPIVLPVSSQGTKIILDDEFISEKVVISMGSPDLMEVKTPVTATLQAISTDTWTSQYVAWNVGSTTKAGTGERISLNGLGRYSFVSTAIPEATSIIILEQDKNTAFFLHDAYSAFYEGLILTEDSTGRQSHQRLLNIDTIKMGSAGGTSIVDLTSKDYVTGAVTVYGADKGRSIFWGTDENDTFISGGGDSVIYGGAGDNQATLGAGIDTLQYRSGVGANDVIRGFDPTKDILELWRGRTESVVTPTFSTQNNSTVMSWAGNTITFEGLANLNADAVSMVTQFA